ncbi:hypothetical protein IWT30_01417 [Secundilactobacillus mixtipabuli]|uniref:Extracellular protein n=2 Tax=Secundilactobacillus mixtipabuli TaxID=1435342 RepID=A0A1Z5ICS2_9LACO|nr:hypothetical protein IWT30_01417 [Secundilactobacillus mixtipabuli]
MNRTIKLIIAGLSLVFMAMGLIFSQSQPTAASSRKTSALQNASQTSVSTRRVTLSDTHQLHVIITAYDNNQNVSHQRYSYRLFRNGKRIAVRTFSDGHATNVISARPGNYSLRVYDQQKQVSFSGGISTSNQPHFV